MIDGRRRSKLKEDGTLDETSTKGGKKRKPNPLGRFLFNIGVTPNEVTIFGVALALICAWTISIGQLWIGIALLTASGLTDFVDGAVARARGGSSVRGAYLDSFTDRIIDTVIFGGVAWYLASSKHPHEAFLPLLVLVLGYLVSYQRAKAESLGMSGKGGLMERAERLIGLGIALSFNGVIMVPILWILSVLTFVTVVQRFQKIWSQATKLDNAETRFQIWLEQARQRKEDKDSIRATSHDSLREKFRLQRNQRNRLVKSTRGARRGRALSERRKETSPSGAWDRFWSNRNGFGH